MLARRPKTILVVHNDEVWWICEDAAIPGHQWFRQPLEQLLADEDPAGQMPEWLQGHTSIMCIFPDHWFGSESYPFQSRKSSLIEPFLERKLSIAYPDRKDIGNFFNYRHIPKNGGNSLFTAFLLEDKGFALYSVLQRLHHQPQRMTSPAFVWEERLQEADGDFARLGTLLIHHTGNECQLYFYHQGNYLFSRIVILGDAADGTEALVFEINQSLYMYSQKAKNELDRVYLVSNDARCHARMSESLGREVVDLSSLVGQQAEREDIPGLEPLNNLLQWSRTQRNAEFFSIIQRQIKRTMEWWPVQITGIVLGLILLLGLVGENLYLRSVRENENRTRHTIETAMTSHSQGIMLSEQAGALDHVLDMAARNLRIEAAFNLSDCFPAAVRINELNLYLVSPPTLKLGAMVQARDPRELTALLSQVVTQIKGTFDNVQAFSLNDIDIHPAPRGQGQSADNYQVAFQLVLP